MSHLRLQLRSNYVGAITVAMLLVFAVEGLVAAVEQPVSSLVTDLVNFVIRHTPLSSLFPISDISVSWTSTLTMLMGSVLFGMTAFGVAMWLYAPVRD